MQTLGGVKQYLAGYIARREQRATEKVRETARREEERQDAERQAYEASRRAQALDLFARLPEPDRAAIEAQALAHAAKFSGSLRTSMIDFGKVRFTIERHGDKLTTFDQWKAERATIS